MKTDKLLKSRKILTLKKGWRLMSVVCTLFFFLVWVEKDLAAQGNLLWTTSYTCKILFGSVCLGVPAGWICSLLAAKGIRLSQKEGKTNPFYAHLPKFVPFWGNLVCILLAWLPCYLAYYPGICAYDTTIQMEQITSGVYNAHHPLIHTLMIQGSIKLGEIVFHSTTAGIGIYSLVQMVILAIAFAYCVQELCLMGIRKGWILVFLVYAAFYPFHWYMGVTVAKDTIFSAFFLMQIVSFCRLLQFREAKHLWNYNLVWLIVSTIGMVLFRNNGKYALLVLICILLLVIILSKKTRKYWTLLSAAIMGGFLVGNLLLSGLFRITNAGPGDSREMLSLPIQQMARCMVYHGGIGVVPEDDSTMSEADKTLVNDFLLDESYREYRPDISDPVKRHTNTYVARYRSREFINTYLHLLVQYPGDYVNAALAMYAGYLSPLDETHAHINENSRDTGLGYVQTRWVDSQLNEVGIYKDSQWESLHSALENWADGNCYLKLPILKYLFVPGIYLWGYLLWGCYLLLARKFRELLPISLVMGYFLTLFLGPTVQLRYLYPLMIAFLPILLISFHSGKALDSDSGK